MGSRRAEPGDRGSAVSPERRNSKLRHREGCFTALDMKAKPRGPLTMLPKAMIGLLHEVSRHLLRRPVVGICAIARTDAGEIVLIRRGDTGEWCLPGGTLEWGETLATAIRREVREESGYEVLDVGKITGVYSRPDRDLRFHAVTVCVEVSVRRPDGERAPMNSLEIRDVRAFAEADLPETLSMGMTDALRDALAGGASSLE
jgi:8-oxo-dGTP diphosphatase